MRHGLIARPNPSLHRILHAKSMTCTQANFRCKADSYGRRTSASRR